VLEKRHAYQCCIIKTIQQILQRTLCEIVCNFWPNTQTGLGLVCSVGLGSWLVSGSVGLRLGLGLSVVLSSTQITCMLNIWLEMPTCETTISFWPVAKRQELARNNNHSRAYGIIFFGTETRTRPNTIHEKAKEIRPFCLPVSPRYAVKNSY